MSDPELSCCEYESDSDLMDDLQSRRQLLCQITELQGAVDDMKSAFTMAIQRLNQVPQDDKSLWDKMEENRVECQSQVSEVLKMMLSMKADFTALKTQVQQSNDLQQNLKKQIQNLTGEKNALIEELYKSGSVSDQMWYSLNRNVRPVGRASSGSHSNDSGVVFCHSMYQPAPSPYLVANDQESSLSILDNPLIESHAMVQDYVTRHSQSQTAPSYDGEGQVLTAYDSDSSLVNAANKSLTLSTSLGKQCGLELDQCELAVNKGAAADSELDEDEYDDQEKTSKGKWIIRNNMADMTDESEPLSMKLFSREGEGSNENLRFRLTKEILESERKYCSMLHTLLKTFAEPLMKTGIISTKDVNTLFPDEISQLYFKHCSLCRSIEDKVQTWIRSSTLGDIFDKFTDPLETNVLQLYTSYIDDFPEVLKTFHKLCRKSTKFTQFLKSCLNRSDCGGLDLGVFLVAPVQRIPQYILLLKKLLKVVDSGHSDVVLISSCLHRLKDSLNRLNDTMEHSFQLIAAQIQQEDDMECMTVRRRLSNVNTGDFISKKKLISRGCRISAKSKEVDVDAQSGVKCKPKLEYRSVSVQSQLEYKDDDDENSGREVTDRNYNSRIAIDQVDDLNTESTIVEPKTKSSNNQMRDGDQVKPVKSKPPVKPCRNRGYVKTPSDVKLHSSAESKDNMDSDVSSHLRSNMDIITNSEPNLAQDQELSLDCQTRVVAPYKYSEKGASLGCILSAPSATAEDVNRIQRPLGKAESSYTIHQVTVPTASGMTTSQSIPLIVSSSTSAGIVQPQIKQKATKGKTKDRKLMSIRASLKNILTFRKRGCDAGNKDPEISNSSSVATGEGDRVMPSPTTAITIPPEVQSQLRIILRRDDDVDDGDSDLRECCPSGNGCCNSSHNCSTV